MSQGIMQGNNKIEDILLKEIPTALECIKTTREDDLRGIDYYITLTNKKKISVDAKIRQKDYGKDDLALEIWSKKETNIKGWTLDDDKLSDYIFWYWKDTKRFCLIPFLLLKESFKIKLEEWKKKHKTATQFTPDGGWHSECVFVPRQIVWDTIIELFGGGKLVDINQTKLI